MAKNRMTTSDIAKRAGVSRTTVSYVINDVPGPSAATREKVLKVIDELGFKPNIIAQAMKTGRTYTIGLVVSLIGSHSFSRALVAIQKYLRREGYHLLVCDASGGEDEEVEVTLELKDRGVDGMLFVMNSLRDSGKFADVLMEEQVPFVILNRHLDGPYNMVLMDVEGGMFQAVEHLTDMGHERIGLFATSKQRQRAFDFDKGVYKGYQSAMEEKNLPYEDLIFYDDLHSIPYDQIGTLLMERVLNSKEPPTAIITANDSMVSGAIRAALRAGLRIPEDISFVAFDSIGICSLLTPSVTGIEQALAKGGTLAAQSLLELMEEPHKSPILKWIPCEFSPRESSGPKRN